MLKIYISYDMQDGKERECQEYLANTLAPGLARMGFQFSQVWFSMWGDAPQILAGGEIESLEKAQSIFLSNDWEKLAEEMEPLVEDFQVKLIQTDDAESL